MCFYYKGFIFIEIIFLSPVNVPSYDAQSAPVSKGNWRESNAMERDAVEKEKRIPQYGVTWPIQLFPLVTTATSIRLISNIRSQVAYIGEQ